MIWHWKYCKDITPLAHSLPWCITCSVNCCCRITHVSISTSLRWVYELTRIQFTSWTSWPFGIESSNKHHLKWVTIAQNFVFTSAMTPQLGNKVITHLWPSPNCLINISSYSKQYSSTTHSARSPTRSRGITS